MPPRIASLSVAALLSLALLSGCPTRSVPILVDHADASQSTSPDDVDAKEDTTTVGGLADASADTTTVSSLADASADTTTVSIIIADAAGADAAVTGAVDASIDTQAAVGVGEQPKLPPPPLSDVGAPCAANAECATGSCIDGACEAVP